MRKIILACDGDNFSEGAFEFACNLNEQHSILACGIFLPQLAFLNPLSYEGTKAVPAYIPLISKEDTQVIEKNIERFKMLCLSHGIEHRVHKDFEDFPLQELAKETRYADLMIVGSELFYEELGVAKAKVYLESALHLSECPVIVVPEKYNFPQKVILTYDGSKNSVHAIKQFAYLFHELTSKQTLVLYSPQKKRELPEKSNIEEFLTCHFSDLVFSTSERDLKKMLAPWTNHNAAPIVVAGSYGRSLVSQLFKESFITQIIKDCKTPVFVAHE